MYSPVARSLKYGFVPLLKKFLLRQHNIPGLDCLASHGQHISSPLFQRATAGFRYKSTKEESSVEIDSDYAGSVNVDSIGELSSNVLNRNDGVADNDDTSDFSEDEASSQDSSNEHVIDKDDDDLDSDSQTEDDKARLDALNFPWLNGVQTSHHIPPVPVPGPIKYFRTKKETFFQFDYRNVERVPITKPEMEVLLEKIEVTLKDAHLEPYGTSRGVATLRKNIDALPDGAKFRMGGGKGSLKKVGEGYDKAVYVTSHRALRKAMFNLLFERHAIITSGWTHNMKKLTAEMLGQSLLGPETRIVVDRKLAQDVIQELWMRGVSSKYNRLIKKHEDRFAERNFLRYLKPKSKEEVANMDWNTDLMLKSDEELARREPTPSTRKSYKDY